MSERSDFLDSSAANVERETARRIAAIAADIPQGVAGECGLCGEEHKRLISGNCPRCRDKHGLP